MPSANRVLEWRAAVSVPRAEVHPPFDKDATRGALVVGRDGFEEVVLACRAHVTSESGGTRDEILQGGKKVM